MPDARSAGHRIRFGSRTIRLPRSKFKRILLGSGLVLGGLLSFLPVLGLWMLPLGFMVLSVDFHYYVARGGDSRIGGAGGGANELSERLKTKKKEPGGKP